jgi:beta-phosphoglucomutase family hydrolase
MKLSFKGAIFDLDGVITQTAEVHFLAWKSTFEHFLTKRNHPNPSFSYNSDYVPYVDGKPRYEGVDSFLKSRGVNLPFGDLNDIAGTPTICGVGNGKNEAYRDIIDTQGAKIYESTLALIMRLQENKIQLGVASSSKNCSFILEKTSLSPLFETIVDGNTSRDLGLKGKPEPDIFLKAAENMELIPHECILFEDAISGVQAGKAGKFGLVIGISRTGEKEQLKINGADVVVDDLETLSLEEIENLYDKELKL